MFDIHTRVVAALVAAMLFAQVEPAAAANAPLIATAASCRTFAEEVWSERQASFKAVSACQKANRPTIAYCPGFRGQRAWAPSCCAAYAVERDAERVYEAGLAEVRRCRQRAAAAARTDDEVGAISRLEEIVETVDSSETLINDTQSLMADSLAFHRSKATPDIVAIATADYERHSVAGSRTERLYEEIWRLDGWARRVAFGNPVIRGIQGVAVRRLQRIAGRLIRIAEKSSDLADRITSDNRAAIAPRSTMLPAVPHRRINKSSDNAACDIFADTNASSALMERDPNAWMALSERCGR